MTRLGRREFLRGGSAGALALALATLASPRRLAAAGFGELIPDPAGVLDLPEGFCYAVLEAFGDPMSDGYRVPARPDGMACFAGPAGTLIVMRNHENSVGDRDRGPYVEGQSPPPEAYDPEGVGGVTRIVVDATSFARISSNLVLIGSARNCAGGPSPWGWLSCEEIFDTTGGHRHGYVFACSIDAASVEPPRPIPGYGRCRHEAAAVDPDTLRAYLTEDRGDSCLYRFVPDALDQPFVGKLQALRVVGHDRFALTNASVGEPLAVEWVDLDEPDPETDTLRAEAQAKGAAILVRGEGIWWFEGQVYVCSTTGGALGAGQIFRLIDGDAPTLELVVVSTDLSVLQNPDNITVAPWGDLFMAEDGAGANYVRWVGADGQVRDFARNAKSSSEICGVCFSPDGRALFLNLQDEGLTLVVTGPFPTIPPAAGESESEGGDESGTTTSGDASETGEPCHESDDASDPASARGCGCSTSAEPAPLATLATLALANMIRTSRS